MFRRFDLGLAALLLLSTPGLVGCQSACSALADRICDCEPNQAEQDVCRLSVDLASNRDVSNEENQACEVRLDTCTCEALENDDVEACGLAKPMSEL